MTTLREAAAKALEALAIGQDAAHEVAQTYHEAMAGYRPARHIAVDDDVRKIEDAITALKAALAEPCPCADRPAAQCPGEWEPGCDLGNNPKYAKRVEMTPKELAASIKRGEKWKVAEPVQELAPFAALVAAAERERIIAQNAPVIEKINAHIKALEDELAAIRARSNTAPPQRKPLTEIGDSNG